MAEYRLSALLTVKDGMSAALRSAAKAAGDLTKGFGGVKDNRIRVNVDGLDKLKRLREQTRGMKFSPIRLNVQVNGATSKITRLREQITNIAGKAHNVIVNVKTNGAERLAGLKNNLSELGSGMMMAGGLGVMGVAGIGYGIADTINTYKDFEMQMRRNKALFTTGMAPEEAQPIYEQLMNTARKYGSTMIYTNAEVGKALEYMALAGWDAQTSMNALPAILNSAVASGEDLAMVSDIITDDMTAMGYRAGTYVKNGMGDMVEATQHFSDVLLRTTLRSNTNFQQLGYAMKYAAPLAHALGYNIEDVAVAMGLMANNGIKADQAGTALRGMLVRMAKAPKQAAEAMEALGVSAFDASGKAKGLMSNLMGIRAALKGKDAENILDFVEQMTGEQIGERGEVADFIRDEMAANGGKLTDKSLAKLASQFSGTYALAGFLAIMNSTDEDIQKLMTEIYQRSDGTGAEINKEMMDTLAGDLKTIQSAWEDLQYELLNGKGASGLRDFLQAATHDIKAFKNALKDGFDLGDIFGLLGNIVTQLKDKLLALDGVGSLLAGGVLMVGLRKLLNMGLRVRNALGEITRLGATAAATGARAATALPATASSVGTMNVKAGVVNLAGAIKGGAVGSVAGVGGAAQSAKAVTSLAAAQSAAVAATNKYQTAQAAALAASARAAQTKSIPDMAAARSAQAAAIAAKTEATAANRRVTAIQNSQAFAQKYYTQREAAIVNNQLGSSAALNAANQARAARIANMKSAVGGGAALAALFGAMDIAATRSSNQSRLADIDAEITEQKKILQDLRGNNETSQDQLNRQVEAIRGLESQRNDIIRQNRADEFRAGAGAAGSIAGTALGALLGSLIGPTGTMIGGMIGGAIGQQLGEYFGNKRVAGGLGEQPVKAEVNDAIIGNAVAEKIGAQPPPQTYEFKNPLERKETDITGLKQKVFFEPGQPLPEAMPTKSSAPNMADLHRITDESTSAIREIQDAQWRARLKADELNFYRGQAERARSDQFANNEQAFDFYRNKAANTKSSEFKMPEFNFGGLIDELFGFKRAAAAELNETQIAQQAAMERGESIQPTIQPTEAPDLGVEGLTENIFSQLEGLGEGVGEIFSGLGETIQTGLTSALEGVGEIFSGLDETIQTGLTSALEGVGETFSTFDETIQTGLTSALEGVGEIFSGLDETIQTGLTSALEGAGETFSTFGETIQTGLTSALEGAGATFATLGEMIGAGLAAAQATADASIASIRASFDSGLQAIQSAWGALPGFFSGVFGSLGGVASAAGAAIYSGLTSVIGGIIGAWQAAASTISGIISSIASMAASVGSMIPSIGGHYKGTASFAGGFTEVNEHGGELMILPSGTKIYPHATTVELLRHEIQKRMREQDGLRELGIGELTVPMPDRDDVQSAGLSAINFAPTSDDDSLPMNLWRLMQNFFRDFDLPEINLPTDSLPVPRFNFPTSSDEGSNTTSNVDNSQSNVSINMGGVNINSGMDFEDFMHQMRNLITGAAENSIQF